jgi:hypothetical protein
MGAHVGYVLKLPYVMKTENLNVAIFFPVSRGACVSEKTKLKLQCDKFHYVLVCSGKEYEVSLIFQTLN